MKHGELVAIGGAYIDINAPDFPIPERGLPLEIEVVGGSYQVEPGGSAVNFARLCSALQIPTVFIGKVGTDIFGNILSDLLRRSGVEPLLVVRKGVSTNVSFNMVNSEGKSIMAVAGTANQALTADEVYARSSGQLAKDSYLYLGGCFKLKKLMPAFVKLAHEAKVAGMKVVLDHARLNESVTEDEKETVRQLALVADFYLPSADEFMQLWKVSSIEEGLELLSKKGQGVTIVKNGDKGAAYSAKGAVMTVPAFRVKPIHTIGAGDSFNAGFIAAQRRGLALPQSVQFGCAVAALKISQNTLPTYDKVADFLARQKE